MTQSPICYTTSHFTRTQETDCIFLLDRVFHTVQVIHANKNRITRLPAFCADVKVREQRIKNRASTRGNSGSGNSFDGPQAPAPRTTPNLLRSEGSDAGPPSRPLPFESGAPESCLSPIDDILESVLVEDAVLNRLIAEDPLKNLNFSHSHSPRPRTEEVCSRSETWPSESARPREVQERSQSALRLSVNPAGGASPASTLLPWRPLTASSAQKPRQGSWAAASQSVSQSLPQ